MTNKKHYKEEKIGLLDESSDLLKGSVNSVHSRRNRLSLLYSTLIILLILSTVGIFSIGLQRKHQTLNLALQKEKLDFEETVLGGWYAGTADVLYNKEEYLIYRAENGSFILLKTNQNEILSENELVNAHSLRSLGCYSCDAQFSPDLKYFLIPTKRQQVFRHSFTAEYKLVTVSTLKYQILTISERELKITRFRHVRFGKTGSQLLLYTGQVIYYKSEADSKDFRILSNIKKPIVGSLDLPNVMSGIPDWVYEEEIYGTGDATWFSNDGNFIAWAEFNDTDVGKIELPKYGDFGVEKHLYMDEISFPYPKSGTKNPDTKLFISNVGMTETKTINLPQPVSKSNPSDYSILWLVQFEDNNVYITWSNRIQNKALTIKCKTSLNLKDFVYDCEEKFYRSSSTGWLQNLEKPFYRVGNSHYWINYCDDYEKIVSAEDNRCLTDDQLNVKKILSSGENYIEFLGRRTDFLENSMQPGQQIYRYSFSDAKTTCVSCSFDDEILSGCTSFSAETRSSYNVGLTDCLGPGPAYSVISSSDKILKTITTNSKLRKELENTYVPSITYFIIEIKGYKFSAKLKHPADFGDKHYEAKDIPLLVNVYAGPDQMKVDDNYGLDFHDWLVTNKSMAVLEIDGRGSATSTVEVLHSVYKNLGDFEIEDQISGVKQTLEKFSGIDKERVGIWGWSYGGYATLRVLSSENGPGVFKCGASVAPVVDWRLYRNSV